VSCAADSKFKVLLEKLVVAQLIKKFPALYKTQSFTVKFTKVTTFLSSEQDISAVF
jgi:hypothetical protein